MPHGTTLRGNAEQSGATSHALAQAKPTLASTRPWPGTHRISTCPKVWPRNLSCLCLANPVGFAGDLEPVWPSSPCCSCRHPLMPADHKNKNLLQFTPREPLQSQRFSSVRNSGPFGPYRVLEPYDFPDTPQMNGALVVLSDSPRLAIVSPTLKASSSGSVLSDD